MNRAGLILFGDFIAFWGSFLVILLVRFGPEVYGTAISTHIIPFTILYLSWTFSFFLFGLYDLFTIKPTIPHLRRFGLALFTSLIIGIFLFYFVLIFGIAPKINLVFQVVCFGLISFFIRRIIYILFSKKITRPVILIGSSPYIEEINQVILNRPELGLKLIFRTNSSEEAISNYSHLQNILFIFEKIPDEVPKESILVLYKNNAEIINVVQAYERYLDKIPVTHIDQSWIIENIDIKENIVYVILKKNN